ncbi:hypothetical protein I350_05782 [Cryptococcus amylolentus CBS 6273]|uniref:Zn(2)-C6 fungal-type domain-containing protein n=1 Tax=Cryptococcus amylolentus CBS 6273 TaxID=1296118 RepID=A0A1E3JPZ5_9TREE|nr:hypothetical protein I350_05782 [Cryptococcus amylolentus CBS 6273]
MPARRRDGESEEGASPPSDTPGNKKRKVHRACDACRRRKIKCNGPMDSRINDKCAYCIKLGLECTYNNDTSNKRGPSKSYVQMLEQKCGRLETLLRQAFPDVDIRTYVGPELDPDAFEITAYSQALASYGIPPYPSVKPLPVPSPQVSAPALNTEPVTSSVMPRAGEKVRRGKDDDRQDKQTAEELSLARFMSRLNARGAQGRNHGKPSPAFLVCQLTEYRKSCAQNPQLIEDLEKTRRSQFWDMPQWETDMTNEGLRHADWSIWPSKGLDKLLIDAYFDHVDRFLPLLNRPRFQQEYDRALWRSHYGFSRVCLMVFANGAKFVQDPRVKLSQEDLQDTESASFTAGWRYFRAFINMGQNPLQCPTLFDLQTSVLLSQFLQGSTTLPHNLHNVYSIGISSAQDLGIHIRSLMEHVNPVEKELYVRAYWCLYHIDRHSSVFFGRPMAMRDVDFDIDYPRDVDDEYWESGDQSSRFLQPLGKVSRVARHIQILKLDRIMGQILHAIYTVNTSRDSNITHAYQSSGQLLDTCLNRWLAELPRELRWDPTCPDFGVLQQTASLLLYFYYCKSLVYRSYVTITFPDPVDSNPTLMPLAACLAAARSISEIIYTTLARSRQEGVPPGHALNVSFMLPAWSAGMIFLFSLTLVQDTSDEKQKMLREMRRLTEGMRDMELVWKQAGKITDFFEHLTKEVEKPRSTVWRPAEGGSGAGRVEDRQLIPLYVINSSPRELPQGQPQSPEILETWMKMDAFEFQMLGMGAGDAGSEPDEEWWIKLYDHYM